MKAFILVGGYGTRLRPLTFACPKSCIPFANMPMIEHQIKALHEIGVVEIIFNFNFQVSENLAGLQKLQEKYGIKMTYSKEQEATGTAGPLIFAKDIIMENDKTGMILVFNSDIICNYPLKQLIEFHKNHGKQASIVLAKVTDPSRYGVVISDETQRVQRFVEKPKEFIGDRINAGIYLLNTSVIDMIPPRFCMLEKEVFPVLAEKGELYGMPLQSNFWHDIGQPKDYIQGQHEYLKFYKHVKEGPNFKGEVLVDPSCTIQEGAVIGPNVVIGPGCVIRKGARITNSTIFQNTVIGPSAHIDHSIISWKCKIGEWVRIEGLTVMAECVTVKDNVRITRAMIMSQKEIGHNIEAGSILM